VLAKMPISTYIVWLTTSCISFALSVLVLLRISIRSELWHKVFHQLTAALAIIDLIGTSSWFYGMKYKEPFITCAIEEYMLQGSFLCKAATTVVICYVSIYAVRTMQIPTSKTVMGMLAVAISIALGFLALLISMDTAQIFCTEDYQNYHMLTYFLCFILPLYSCVGVNLIMYLQLRSNLVKICESRLYGEGSDQLTLLIIVRKLLFYPLIFSLLLLPEAVAILIYLFTGRDYFVFLRLLAAACMGLTGSAVAMNYFYQQQLIPDIKHLYLYSEGPVNPLATAASNEKGYHSNWWERETTGRSTTARDTTVGDTSALRHTEVSEAEIGRRKIVEM
jgi:hypothetical protein